MLRTLSRVFLLATSFAKNNLLLNNGFFNRRSRAYDRTIFKASSLLRDYHQRAMRSNVRSHVERRSNALAKRIRESLDQSTWTIISVAAVCAFARPKYSRYRSSASRRVYSILINVLTKSPALTRYIAA